jgi:hypothetical protein
MVLLPCNEGIVQYQEGTIASEPIPEKKFASEIYFEILRERNIISRLQNAIVEWVGWEAGKFSLLAAIYR